jgi:hypothetical protein
MDVRRLSVGCDMTSLCDQDDVDTKSMSHISPQFMSSIDPICLLGHDMCHPLTRPHVTPDPHCVSTSSTCPFGQSGW